MSIALMNAAWRLNLGPTHKLVLLAMCDWANDTGLSCHPSIKAISVRASVSARQVQRVLRDLMEAGWLTVVGNQAGGAPGQTRHYSLNVEAITTGDMGVTGDTLSRVTSKTGTGDMGVVGRVTPTTQTGDTHVTQSTIDPPINRKSIHHSSRVKTFTSERFTEFWNIYPRKVGSTAKAEKSWQAQKLDAIADQILTDVTERIADDPQWRDVQFIPYPTTYLNGKRWNDQWRTASKRPSVNDRFSGSRYEGSPDHEIPDYLVGAV